MIGLEFVQAYIDDLLIITKFNWEDYLTKLSTVFDRISEVGFKINIKKSFFGHSELLDMTLSQFVKKWTP